MTRHPDWFERLDAILEVVRQADNLKWLSRTEVKAIFNCSKCDSIRLLHIFGAEEQGHALSVSRSSLLAQLEAIRGGSAFATFSRQRQAIAKQLAATRAESSARELQGRLTAAVERSARLQDLPKTITWRRVAPSGPARFEILYDDAADLMWQLSEFLQAARCDRAGFFRGTEFGEDPVTASSPLPVRRKNSRGDRSANRLG